MSSLPARLAIVHSDRPLGAVTAEMVAALRDRGATVDVLRAAGQAHQLTHDGPHHDLYVLKHSDEATLTMGAVLHAAGAATLNPYPVAAACRDKALATSILARARLPVPASHYVTDPGTAAPLLSGGALVVKPNRGSKGQGVRVVRTARDLAAIDPAGGPFVVQRHHAPDGRDRKLYRIGDAVFCIGRPWPAVTADDKHGQLLEVDPALRRIALGVGDALGIDLYGADVVCSQGRPWLVDVSAFPGFKGVPHAGRLLADRVLAAVPQPADEVVA